MLIRVRKDEFHKYSISVEPDGVVLGRCLDAWLLSLAHGGDRDLGVKNSRLLTSDTDAYGSGKSAADREYERELEIGAATGAMIESLSRLHEWAICKITSQPLVWQFPNADIFVVVPQAELELIKKLKKNCCTGSLFC